MSRLVNYYRRYLPSAWLAIFVALTLGSSVLAVDKKYWELSPYTIRIELAVEDADTARRLAAYLRERILGTLHPLWSTELVIVEGEDRYRLLGGLSALDSDPPTDEGAFDKRMYLTVSTDIEGYRLACREWDKHTQLWGPVLHRTVRQELMLFEQCFELLHQTFAPLAIVETNEKDPNHVSLVFKGRDLPQRLGEAAFGRAGEAYLPLMIRFDHQGEVLPEGISVVPWTYLTLEKSDARQWQALVHSGIRLPFGARRRGRSEHVAIALRNPPAPTQVRFHARHDATQGLSSYQVFRQLPDSEKSDLLGLTDATGSITLNPEGGQLTTLLLRSEGQLLAKVPVVPGAKRLVEVPVADDTARLRAQADMTAVREQLIDIVARRSILMARARARVKDGKLDDARELLEELDNLPGRTQFEQMIAAAERNPQNASTDERIQQRIKKQFADTRMLLGRFLDARQVSELHSEVRDASRPKEKAKEPPAGDEVDEAA